MTPHGEIAPWAWWHNISTVEEFCTRSGLDGHEKTYLLSCSLRKGRTTPTLATFLFLHAKHELENDNLDIPTTQNRDVVIRYWIQIVQKRKSASWNEIKSFSRELRAKYEAEERKNDTYTWSDIDIQRRSTAFNSIERETAGHGHPSSAMIAELRGQFAKYVEAPSLWMGPYTTIIGPSGIGKSFSIKQFAVRHGFHVAYSNLASNTAKCYPRPIVIGNIPTPKSNHDSLVKEWTIFLNLQLCLIRCGHRIGITAPGLFSLMTSSEPDIVKRRCELQASSEAVLESEMAGFKDVLVRHGKNIEPCTGGPNTQEDTFVIICLDEARALLHDDSDNMSFRALREAARCVFENNKEAPFFLVLLDTTSRISHFTPPVEQDPSRKSSEKKIFPPIYQINTWDLFAPKEPHEVDGTESAVVKLFSYGRPLWGANMEAGDTPTEVVNLATQKLTGNSDARFLALLSCRNNFYVTSRQLAETLVASWMRFLISFSESNNTMLTVQPSEPVLAYVSSRELQNPKVRLRCIKVWFDSLQKGACNLGDVGEMIAALILLFAADYVSRPLESRPHAMSMRDFWTSFLGSSSWLAVEQHCSNAQNILDVLENGMVFYNHFIRIPHIPTIDDLATAYRQGAAIFLPANFPGMDIAIPVNMGYGKDFSVLLIQVKNRKADSPTSGLRQALTGDLKKTRKALVDPDRSQCVVLGLAMCLRCHGDPAVDITMPPKKRKPIQRTTKASSSSSASTKPAPKELSNLLGIVFGLDMKTYPCLAKITADSPEHQAMAQVCSLFQDILERWPNFYPARDTQSAYAKNLLYPFYSGNAKETELISDEEEEHSSEMSSGSEDGDDPMGVYDE